MSLDIPAVTINQLPAITTLAELLGADRLDIIKREAAEERAMWRMTPAERIAAMYRGELRGKALRTWAIARPHEVPATGLAVDDIGEVGLPTTNGVGEYPWILRHTPEYCGE